MRVGVGLGPDEREILTILIANSMMQSFYQDMAQVEGLTNRQIHL